jgi:hypothetical protein
VTYATVSTGLLELSSAGDAAQLGAGSLTMEVAMVTVLTVFICLRGFCAEVFIPTPATFACDDSSYHEKYIAENFPKWKFEMYRCDPRGRDA